MCVSLVQSAGYGKTKACLDFCRDNQYGYRCVYLECGDTSNREPWLSSPEELQWMMAELESYKEDEIVKKAQVLVWCIYTTARKYTTKEDLYKA